MRMLYLVYFDAAGHGGYVSHVRGVVGALERQGHELKMLAPGWEGRDPAVLISAWQWKRAGFHTLTFMLCGLPLFVRELTRNRPEVIYARYFNFLFVFAAVARLFRVPMFVEHNADIRAEHNLHRRRLLARKFSELAESLALTHTAGSIVVTDSIARAWRARYRLNDVNVTVIRNGVDAAIFRPQERDVCRNRLGLEISRKLVCYVGTFSEAQGLDTLMDAFEVVSGHVPESVLTLVGGRPGEVEAATNELRARGLEDRVRVTGWVSESVAADYIGASDVCVAPYAASVALMRESVGPGSAMTRDPLKIYSYMACGRPVVASHFREAGFHLEEIGAGLAVPPDDPGSLARAICVLLNDEELAAKLGASGRRYVEENATWDMVGRRTAEFIRASMRSRQAQSC